jgi:hypothetical protein
MNTEEQNQRIIACAEARMDARREGAGILDDLTRLENMCFKHSNVILAVSREVPEGDELVTGMVAINKQVGVVIDKLMATKPVK